MSINNKMIFEHKGSGVKMRNCSSIQHYPHPPFIFVYLMLFLQRLFFISFSLVQRKNKRNSWCVCVCVKTLFSITVSSSNWLNNNSWVKWEIAQIEVEEVLKRKKKKENMGTITKKEMKMKGTQHKKTNPSSLPA